MDPHDEILDGTPAAGRQGSLGRIPPEGTSVEPEPVRSAEDPGPAPSVAALVGWMVARPARRAALGARLQTPDILPAIVGEPPSLADRLLDRCRREVHERGLEPGTLDLGARLEAACTPVAAQGVDLDVHLADDVPGRFHADGDLLQRVFAILAASSGFGGAGRHVEVRIERAGDGPDRGPRISVLGVRVGPATLAHKDEAGSPGLDPAAGDPLGRAGGLSPVDGLAIGVCEALVAETGGRLAAEADPDGGPCSRFTLPTATR